MPKARRPVRKHLPYTTSLNCLLAFPRKPGLEPLLRELSEFVLALQLWEEFTAPDVAARRQATPNGGLGSGASRGAKNGGA